MSEIITESKFMTLEQLSKRYQLPLSTLRRWCSERRFSVYRISNRIRVSVEEWEEWLRKFHIEGKEN